MMKNILLLFVFISVLACKDDAKSPKPTIPDNKEVKTTKKQKKSQKSTKKTEQIKDAIEDFNTVLNKDANSELPKNQSINREAIEKLYQYSGIPKEEYQDKLNNPDTLKALIKQVQKNIKDAIPRRGPTLKGDITLEQLTSKNTSTGVSIEDAILVLQKDLKGKFTPEKAKKIDAMSGTQLISKLPERDARKVLQYVYTQENKRLRPFTIKAGYMHDAKEADSYLIELETMLKNYNDGTIKASPSYKSKIERSIKIVKTAQKKIAKLSKTAQADFKKLNPDLYFGEDVGETFFGGKVRNAVYLPLGRLSFADTVISARHPKLNVTDLNNVIGSPDMIQDNGAMTVTGIYSLGLAGSLTVKFNDNALTDVKGPDLYIFEIGKIEPTTLEISKDGKTWIKVGKIDGGVSEVDIAEFVQPDDLFYYVRLTDLKQYSALPGADVDAIAAIGAAMRLKLDSKVLFETGKSELKPEGIDALKELAESIKVLKKGNVIVEGHTDDVGDASFNKKLSLARAKSAIVELKKLIPSSQFNWKEKGLGESKPIVENDTDDNRAKNRRVEVLVIPK
ncbi:OmpA family protein [Olleya sp. R77988]|uniref:OmpA family protein n=1 Tax=Olleya sp. R77988 TaxID=3093875 RepID=UPI0037C8E0D2